MGMPLAELMQCMTGEEFGLHWAQYRKQPWGPQRDEVHAATIAHTVANFAGKAAESEVPFSTFLPYSAPPRDTTPVAEPDPIEWMMNHGR